MPTTENDRRNRQQPVLENPSLPDHDRKNDPGMHTAVPEEFVNPQTGPGALDEEEIAPPDQEFGQVLQSGPDANQGRIPEDPNNWLTSDPSPGTNDRDPEDRGDSLPDILERTQH
jgi:hypothetical protein